MKLLAIIIFLLIPTYSEKSKVSTNPINVSSIFINPYLFPSTTIMSFPLSDARINLVCPAGINLSNIKIPNINIGQMEISTAVTLSERFYKSYAKFVNANEEQVKAAHNMANARIQHAIESETIKKGCTISARIVVDGAVVLKNVKTAFSNKLQLPFLIKKITKDVLKNKAKKVLFAQGCKVTAKYVGKEVIEISLITNAGLNNSVEQMKSTLGYLNSIEGMLMIMSRIER